MPLKNDLSVPMVSLSLRERSGPGSGVTVMDVVALHVADCELEGLRPRTIEARLRVLRVVDRDLGLLTADTRAVKTWLGRRGWSPQTRATYRMHLGSFYRWALRAGYVPVDPMVGVPRIRVPQGLPRPVPSPQVAHVLASASGRMRRALTLAAYAGLRSCEIVRVRSEDLASGRLVVPEGKGGRPRVVPVHPAIAALAASAPDGWWFPATAGHMSAHRLTLLAGVYLRSVGVDATLHRCRHSFATTLLEQTGDLRVVQELLGHASPTSTAVYTLVTDARRSAAIAGLSYA